MSGHSKWANIRVRKTAEDKKRSVVFTKMAKNIRVAVRLGGGTDPKINSNLKSVLDRAREVNMPKDNIDRILSRFEMIKDNLQTFFIEGYGPSKIPVVVEVETDNKIRTTNEIRLIFAKYGGSIGENNCVMYMFDKLGRISLANKIDDDNWEKLVELGAVDIFDNTILVYFEDLGRYLARVVEMGFEVIDSGVFLKPKTEVEVGDDKRDQFYQMIREIEANDDFLAVFSNLKGFLING